MDTEERGRAIELADGGDVVMITNSAREVYEPLNKRLQSRLRESVTITLNAYFDDKLVRIPEDRVE